MALFNKKQKFDYSAMRIEAENKKKIAINDFDQKFNELLDDAARKISSEAKNAVLFEVDRFYQGQKAANIESYGVLKNKHKYSGPLYYTVKLAANGYYTPLIYTDTDDRKGICFRTQDQLARFIDKVNQLLSDYQITIGVAHGWLWITADLGKLK